MNSNNVSIESGFVGQLGAVQDSNEEAASDLRELILYACPIGPLAEQLDCFFQKSLQLCGPNTAHRYMPHCTLTGFFHDEGSSIPAYMDALERALSGTLTAASPEIAVTGMYFKQGFHFLAIASPWLQQLTATFAQLAQSSTRTDEIRLKTDLHVSLAYGFAPDMEETLRAIAEDLLEGEAADVGGWELRFYERGDENQWFLHGSWALDESQNVL